LLVGVSAETSGAIALLSMASPGHIPAASAAAPSAPGVDTDAAALRAGLMFEPPKPD
jgi:hypothetical protein